jgi:plasmid maintenance system antidote protein VapI
MTTSQEPEQEYHTAAQIAAYLGVTEEEFLVLAGHHDLHAVEMDEQHVFKVEDVRRFLFNTGMLEGESHW